MPTHYNIITNWNTLQNGSEINAIFSANMSRYVQYKFNVIISISANDNPG